MTKRPTDIDRMIKEMLPALEKLASNCEDHMSCESCESAKPIPNTKQRICGLTIVLQPTTDEKAHYFKNAGGKSRLLVSEMKARSL